MNIENKIECSKVFVKKSNSISDNYNLGAFANTFIKKNELIEKGIAVVLPEGFNGEENVHVFTWSENIPNKTWAMLSGCITFYNTSIQTPNVKVIRDYDNNEFQVIAIKDIMEGEELFHTYKSIKWRKSFKELYTFLQNN